MNSKLENCLQQYSMNATYKYNITKGICYMGLGESNIVEIQYWLPIPFKEHKLRLKDVISMRFNSVKLNEDDYTSVISKLGD